MLAVEGDDPPRVVIKLLGVRPWRRSMLPVPGGGWIAQYEAGYRANWGSLNPVLARVDTGVVTLMMHRHYAKEILTKNEVNCV